MVKVTKVVSGSKYEELESYSRLVAIDDWIFVSNTAGRNYKTREMSTDPVEQAKQCFNNIERALQSIGSTLADVIKSNISIPNVEHAPSVMAYVGERFKGINPQRLVTCTPLGAADFLVEIEVTAYRGASTAETEIVDISQ
jgi:enamine deaminase RidA (YjgF/YER057c/UK114 family)